MNREHIHEIKQLPPMEQAAERHRIEELEMYTLDEQHPGFSEFYAQFCRQYKETCRREWSDGPEELVEHFRPMATQHHMIRLVSILDVEEEHDTCPCCGCSCGGEG